jgi:flagellar biosynthesis/type III secretory pathway protein FliH
MNTSEISPAPWRPPALGGAGPEIDLNAAPVPWTVPDLEGRPARDGASEGGEAPRVDPDEAFARGYAEGIAAGEARGRGELQAAGDALRNAAQALVSSRARILHDLEANLGAVAVAAARKLVQKEIEADPSLVRSLVERGLDLVKPDSPVEVRLHPADLEAVRADIRSLAEDQSLELTLVADPAIERGGFVLDTPRRTVDGRLEEGLRALYERLAYE